MGAVSHQIFQYFVPSDPVEEMMRSEIVGSFTALAGDSPEEVGESIAGVLLILEDRGLQIPEDHVQLHFFASLNMSSAVKRAVGDEFNPFDDLHHMIAIDLLQILVFHPIDIALHNYCK